MMCTPLWHPLGVPAVAPLVGQLVASSWQLSIRMQAEECTHWAALSLALINSFYAIPYAQPSPPSPLTLGMGLDLTKVVIKTFEIFMNQLAKPDEQISPGN